MRTITLVLLAGTILGFALAQIFQLREASPDARNSSPSLHGRITQNRSAHKSRDTYLVHERSSKNQHPFSQNWLGQLADTYDPDPLSQARIISKIGELDKQGISDFLLNPTLVNSESELVDRAKTTAYLRWIELDAPRAISELQSHPAIADLDHIDDTEIIAQGFGLWTLAHPDHARQWLENWFNHLDHLEADQPVISELLQGDELITAFIQNHERVRKGKTQEIASVIPVPEAQQSFLEILAEVQVDQESSPTILKGFLENDGDFRKKSAIAKLLEMDPLFSREWLSRQPSSAERDHFIIQAADTFCTENFSEGAQWYLQQELSTPEARSGRLRDLVSQIFDHQDSQQAASWLRAQPDTSARDAAESYLAHRSLNNQNFEEAVAWISEIESPEARQRIISEVLPSENTGTDISLPDIPESGNDITRNSIAQILNNPHRGNSDFIGTADRVYIPGIPGLYSETDRAKFREEAKKAGLISPDQKN